MNGGRSIAKIATFALVCGSVFITGCNQPKKETVPQVKRTPAPPVESPRKGTTLLVTGDTILTPAQQDTLLAVARRSMAAALSGNSTPPAPRVTDSVLRKNHGCMVMVMLGGKVRGTSGYVLPIKPLVDGVNEMAARMVAAGGHFEPLPVEDIPTAVIVIAVISEPVEIKSETAITPGKNGLVILKGGSVGGVLLPEDVLREKTPLDAVDKLLTRAGSSRDELKSGAVQIHTFTLQRFSDESRK